MEKRRTDYIITNRVKINSNRKIIEKDLMNWINQKYTFCFSEHYQIKAIIKETAKNVFNDGFDIGCDFFSMK